MNDPEIRYIPLEERRAEDRKLAAEQLREYRRATFGAKPGPESREATGDEDENEQRCERIRQAAGDYTEGKR